MKDIKKTVTAILMGDEKARNSDRYLYIEVCKRYCPEALNMNFEEAFLHANLPNTETVRRARQFAQAHHKFLRPSETVQAYRDENENKYRKQFGKIHL